MGSVIKRRAVKCAGILDLLVRRPALRRDALVVFGSRYAVLAVVLPVGCECEHALDLHRVGRRFLLCHLIVRHDGRWLDKQVRGEPAESRAPLSLEPTSDGAEHVERGRLDVAHTLQNGENMHFTTV